MKQARGEVRRLLIVIGKLQSYVGNARNLHYNDRDQTAFVEAQYELSKAFELCVKTTGDYAPIADKDDAI